MINIDDRVGSVELAVHLPKQLVRVRRLPYADAAWIGNGPDDTPVLVGLERKALRDALGSMRSGRFAGHQLPGLVANYNVSYLVVEGVWRPDPDTGGISIPSGKGRWRALSIGGWTPSYRELECWLASMEANGGMRIRRTSRLCETAKLIQALYHWWVDKNWDEHRAHLVTNSSVTMQMRRPGVVQLVASQLPGIGAVRAVAVAKAFGTLGQLASASEEDWRRIDGVGKKIARQLVELWSPDNSSQERR